MGDGAGELDFAARERALLGDDADQFATENDKVATVEDGDDDLLGGDSSFQANTGTQEMMGFESSFPAIDTTNEVRHTHLPMMSRTAQATMSWARTGSMYIP